MHFLSVPQAALVVLRKVAGEGSGDLWSAHIPPQTRFAGLGLSIISVLTGKEFSGQLKSLWLRGEQGEGGRTDEAHPTQMFL